MYCLKVERMKLLFFLLIVHIGIITNVKCQFKFIDSCVKFNLYLKIENPYSDTIVYRYKDCSKAAGIIERVVLKNGEARISGYFNRSAEMIVNCDLNAPFEDSSFYRLILEPGDISVNLIMTGAKIISEATTGSISQNERQKWNSENKSLLEKLYFYSNEYSSFLKANTKRDSEILQKKQLEYQYKLDVLNELKVSIGLEYIKKYPGSYFSAALLFRFKSIYTVDTIMKYFNMLSPNVQQCDFGKYVLDDVFKRSNNWEFFAKYMDSSYYRKLKNIKSIYDLSLTALNGQKISLSKFKGKILLLDFWASWCKPCIANVPVLNQLIGELKGYPVEIISVSMDTKEDPWRNAVLKNNYNGVHLIDKDGLLATYYKVLWAPKYVIISSDGELLNSDAPSVNSPLLKKAIFEVVKKDKY